MALRGLTFLAAMASAAAKLRDGASIPALSEAVQIRWAQDPSYCVQTEGNAIGNGVKLQLWKCDDSWSSGGQVFYPYEEFSDFPNTQLQLYGSTGFCVVVDSNHIVNGAQIQVSQCIDEFFNNNQDWVRWAPPSYPAGHVNLAPLVTLDIGTDAQGLKYCMVIDGNRPFNGAKIELWTCTEGHADQMWQLVNHG